MRLDKFLKVSRVIKRRTVANEACDNGRVRVNGRTAKAGTAVKPGDVVEVEFAGGSTKFEVLSVEENVKKSGAAEMYRIITSLIFVFFLCISLLTGCAESEPQEKAEVPLMKAGESVAVTIDYFHVYDEQFCYFFSMAANELSEGNYSNEWMAANLDAVLDRTLEICQEQAALYDKAAKAGMVITETEDWELMTFINDRISENLKLASNESINSYDEICIRLTGMNYAEYRRYLRRCQLGEKLCRSMLASYHPSEEEQLSYYQAHAEEFQACSAGKIYISEGNAAKANQVLDMVKSNMYPFEIIARGWSEDADVLTHNGYMDLCVSDDTLPEELKQWIRDSDPSAGEPEAVMLHVDGDGYYILLNRGRVGFSESAAVRSRVLETMGRNMLSEYKQEIIKEERYQIPEFDRERAIQLVNKFVEGRQQ